MQLPVHLERFVQVYPTSFFTGTKATMVVDSTVDGENNKEDKTREEADITFSPFFSPKVSKAVQK